MIEKAQANVAELMARMMAKELYLIENKCLVEPTELAALLHEHLLYVIAIEKSGALFASGPLFDESGAMTGDGMTIVRAASFDEAEAMAAGDPFVVAGLRAPTVRRWVVNEGRIGISVDMSSRSAVLI